MSEQRFCFELMQAPASFLQTPGIGCYAGFLEYAGIFDALITGDLPEYFSGLLAARQRRLRGSMLKIGPMSGQTRDLENRYLIGIVRCQGLKVDEDSYHLSDVPRSRGEFSSMNKHPSIRPLETYPRRPDRCPTSDLPRL